MDLTNLPINEFMKNYVNSICEKGLDDEMCQEAVRDAVEASRIGVSTESEFKTFFYIDHFVELECGEICGTLSQEESFELKKFMFENSKALDFSNLVTYRAVALRWMDQKRLNKKAYKNAPYKPNNFKPYDLDSWRARAAEVNKLVSLGWSLSKSIGTMVKNLSSQESSDFKDWYDFTYGKSKNLYAGGDHKNMLKIASVLDNGIDYWAIDLPRVRATDIVEVPRVSEKVIQEQKANDLNTLKNKMVARTFAIDKLLERYRESLSHEQIEVIEDSLNDLRKKIRKLKLASSISDSVIKTANILKKASFTEGSTALIKLADEPSVKNEAKSINDLKVEDFAPILEKLYDVSVRLKRRGIVREIASIDLDLYNLNVASFFPELTDAQAKLIEAFGYASNKIEDVIPKLRSASTEPALEKANMEKELGGVKPELAPKPQTPAPAAPGAQPAKPLVPPKV